MNKKKIEFAYYFIIFEILLIIMSSCNKDEDTNTNNILSNPVLSTIPISNISYTSSICGGNVTSDGGSAITSRGVCWSTLQNPTISDNKTIDGTGSGEYISHITDLTPATTYFVKAYATNSVGTAYGNEISFTTYEPINPTFNIVKVIDGKEIRNIIKTNDGGYIGIAYAFDYKIIKFDVNFNILWNKTYGGSDGDYPDAIIQCLDGGFMVIGETKSSDGDVSLNHGGYDIWICRLDIDGNLIWEKCYGGINGEGLSKEKSISQTNDGDYIFLGYTESNNEDISFNHGGYDAWLVKINSTGDIIFEKTFGGSNDDFGRNIIENDFEYNCLMKVSSSDGDFDEAGNWVVKIDQFGNKIWSTNLHGSNSGFINKTIDNEIIAVNTNFQEFLISKLNSNGNIILSKTISFQSIMSKQPSAVKIIQTLNKGFIVIGSLGNGIEADALIFRLSPDLNLLYNKIYPGNEMDMSASLIHETNDEFLYQIFTSSNDLEGIQHSSSIASVIIKLEE